MNTRPHLRLVAFAAVRGGLIAGAVDILAASLITQYSVVRILKIIAGGLLGKAALAGGAAAAALGFVLQEAMGVLIALVYGLGTRRWPNIARHWILAGIAYGIVVYFVMNDAVVPLSAWHSRPQFHAVSFMENMAAMWLFGLMVSFFARDPNASG